MTVIRLLPFWIMFQLLYFNAYATIIVPFRDLGEVLQAADLVVYGEVEDDFMYHQEENSQQLFIVNPLLILKGDYHLNEKITIKNYHRKYQELEAKVWGDLNPESGKKYLLFLKHSNQPGMYTTLCMSYYCFEETVKDEKSYLVPVAESTELHLHERPDGQTPEPLRAYLKSDLLKFLYNLKDNPGKWKEGAKVLVTLPPDDIIPRVDPPSHCTFIFAPNLSRWQDFPGTPLPVSYRAGGDAQCSNAVTYTQDAVTVLNSNYLGIKLDNNGPFSGYTPNCTGGSASGGNFTSYCNSNLGGARNVCVIYNDPCSEIPDLSGCAGILAIGGHYAGGSHSFQGKTWLNAMYGYVIINEIGSCYCSAGVYQIMLEHELTHTLGIGHIAPSYGDANMNPSCCKNISTLDVDCLDYTYPASMPVTLVSFSGKLDNNEIFLLWETAEELNNQEYIIEQSTDGIMFDRVRTVVAAGTSSHANRYELAIPALPGQNYIRLSQVDFDGTLSYIGNILSFNNKTFSDNTMKAWYSAGQLVIYPVSNVHNDEYKIEIYNAVGIPVRSVNVLSEKILNIDVSDLPVGIYLANINGLRAVKFIRMD